VPLQVQTLLPVTINSAPFSAHGTPYAPQTSSDSGALHGTVTHRRPSYYRQANISRGNQVQIVTGYTATTHELSVTKIARNRLRGCSADRRYAWGSRSTRKNGYASSNDL